MEIKRKLSVNTMYVLYYIITQQASHLSHRYMYMITSSHNPTCFVSREIDNLRQPYDKRIVFQVS